MYERWVMAIRIQCFARSVLSKITLRKLRHDEWQRRHPLAAVQIQRLFRGMLGRGYAKVRQMEVERRKQLEKRSCILIQSTVRRLAARKIVNLMIFEKEELKRTQIENVIKIQSAFRTFVARNKLSTLKDVADALKKLRENLQGLLQKPIVGIIIFPL